MLANHSRRRWYQFSLRGLLVAVTLVALPLGWVGYQMNWIRQRREYAERGTPTHWKMIPVALSDRYVPAPGVLWLFGESGWEIVPAYSQDEARVQALFPEAKIHIVRPATEY